MSAPVYVAGSVPPGERKRVGCFPPAIPLGQRLSVRMVEAAEDGEQHDKCQQIGHRAFDKHPDASLAMTPSMAFVTT
jgi:hypothetical protein